MTDEPHPDMPREEWELRVALLDGRILVWTHYEHTAREIAEKLRAPHTQVTMAATAPNGEPSTITLNSDHVGVVEVRHAPRT